MRVSRQSPRSGVRGQSLEEPGRFRQHKVSAVMSAEQSAELSPDRTDACPPVSSSLLPSKLPEMTGPA